jgi:hypothetical protein
MKKSIAIAVCVLASLAAVTASAQDHATRATIPFAFYVGNTWLPAGQYIVTSDAGSSIVTVRNLNKSISAMRMAGSAEQPASDNEMVFDRCGDKLFLRDVLSASGGLRVELPVSKAEKYAEEHQASAGTPTTVYLALR